MDQDIRLVAKIYRAIQDFSDTMRIDQTKCERIAQLIHRSDVSVQLEAAVEQYADRIPAMHPEEFVRLLRDKVEHGIERQEQDVGFSKNGRRVH